jgi:hypothetical protein
MGEQLTKDQKGKQTFNFYDETNKLLGITKELNLSRDIIIHYPFTFQKNSNEIKAKRISCIEFRGWTKEAALPKDFKVKSPYGFRSTRAKNFFSLMQREFKAVKKIILIKTGKNKFTNLVITLNWTNLVEILKAVDRNKKLTDDSRKAIIRKGISTLNKKYKQRTRELSSVEFQHFISNYTSFEKLKPSDLQTIAEMMGSIETSTITATEFILKTKDKLDIKYLDDVISAFEGLLKNYPKKEEEWQKFFAEYTWTLNHLFPFQVILFKDKAYVGGKTLKNDEGRIVDFLFKNGFQDNFALLEIKTSGTKLLKSKAYRAPDVFALDDELSGAINQCLDQKNTFLGEYGKNEQAFDPKALLVIGNKANLSAKQVKCFELYRANQKNVEIVTFDELLSKLHVLRDVITGKLKKI